MKKLINAVDDVVNESLAGFCAAHSDIVRLGETAPFVVRHHLKQGKVALVSGGGSGHEPLHGGFVGTGMLDAAVPGQVFTSPTPDLILAAAEAADTGGGAINIKTGSGLVSGTNLEGILATATGGNGTVLVTVGTGDGQPRTTTQTLSADNFALNTTLTGAGGVVVSSTDTSFDPMGRPLASTRANTTGLAPVGRWKLNDASGNTAADSSGNLPLTATGDVGIGNPFLGGGGPRGIQLAAKFTF